MPTQTSSVAQSTAVPRAVYPGNTTVPIIYNSGSTTISASATVILMAKVPNRCYITRIYEYHSSGAATCPTDIGVVGDNLSVFASQATQGAVTTIKGLPYRVSITDTNTQQFVYVAATPTAGTNTASVKIDMVVEYVMD